MKNAAKVGLFLILFVVLVVSAYQILGRSLFPSKRVTYYVRLTDAAGLVEGTKVLMAGVQIGTVRQVRLIDPHHAQFTLSLVRNTQLPIGSIAVIPGSLVGFGESQLTIVPPAEVSGFLASGSTIEGKKAGPLDSFLPDGGTKIVGNIDKSLEAVRKLLQDQGLQNDLRRLLATANQTLVASQASLARFNSLSDRTNNLIAMNQGNFHAILGSVRGTLEQVHYTASTLANFARSGKLQNGTQQMLAKATQIEDQTSGLLARLNKIAADPALQENLKTSAANVTATTERGPQIADNVKELTANLNEIAKKSQDLPDKLSEVATKASTLEDSLTALMNKFSGVKPPSTAGLKDLHAELDLTRELHPGYWRTDVNLTYPLKQGYITAGLYDAFESNKINLQLARTFAKALDLRYGIYASKPGIGVDYQLTRRFSVRTDLFNINSPELDARMRYDFGGGIIGWAGVDRAFEKSLSPNFGIGIRE